MGKLRRGRIAILVLLSLLSILAVSQGEAQPPGPIYSADRALVAGCLNSLKRDMPFQWAFGLPSYGSADICILAETKRCVRDNEASGLPLEYLKRDCALSELHVWEQLLQEAHDQLVAKIPGIDKELLPRFVRAHEAWANWAEQECQYEDGTYNGGTDRPFIYQWCMVVLTARRVIYYRMPGVPGLRWP